MTNIYLKNMPATAAKISPKALKGRPDVNHGCIPCDKTQANHRHNPCVAKTLLLALLLALLAPCAALAQHRDCDEPIAITADAPYIEDFESPAGVPYNWTEGPVPDCWGQYTTGPALPHITNQGGALEGAQCLSFYSQGDQYAILPEFSTAINLLKISFWKKYGNGLQLGYITAADNGTCNTFTAIETYYGGGSVWTQHVTYLSDVPETAHRLVFKRPGEGSSCFIDYVEVTFFDGCYNVGTLSISDPTAHSVHLSWDLIDDSQTEWNVQVATNADFTENLVEYLADSHEDYLLNNLDGGTVYHVRVGPTCSEYWWSNTVVFATQCDGPVTVTADAPYTQGFEDGVIPGCWDVYAPEYYDAPYVYNYHHTHSGSYILWFNGTGYAVLPEFSNPLDELQISFWIKGRHQLQLGYITAEDDGTCNTFMAIADYTHTPSETWVQCTNYLLNMPATAHRLAFKAYDVESSHHVPIDDVEVAVVPLGFCYPVGNVSLGRVASNAAYLSWEVYDAEQTTWDVQVATDAAFTENVANHVAYSHENYLVEGLDPDTYYYVRVKPTCTDDLWSSTVPFWTMPPCNGPITVTADAPYTEGFENPEGTDVDEPGRLPACWESYTTGGVGPHNATPDSEYVHGGSQSLSFRSITGDDTYVILPEFSNPLNELQISFWLRGYDQLQLGYLTAEDAGTCNTFTAIADLVVTSTGWTQHFFYLPNVPDTAHRLAIKTNINYLYCFIDDVEVSLGPDCYSVGNLSVGEVSSTSAYLSWALIDNSQTAWNVQLATDEDFTDIVAEYEADTHENYLLEGLGIATQYYVRVKPTCSNDLWNTIDFTTLCGPYGITLETPYTQGFESPVGTAFNASGPLPPCWEAYITGYYGLYPHNCSSWGLGNTQSLAFYNNDLAYAILPEFSNPLNQLQISFWMKADDGGTLQLGYLTAEDDGTCNSFTVIATYNNNNGNLIQHSTVLDNVPAEAERLAFSWYGIGSLLPCCNIDAVVVSINPCAKPHNIAAAILTHQTADITWESVAESCTLRYREVMETSWTTPEDATAITGHTYRITGLEAGTTYEMQMKNNCDDSEWSETLTFTTSDEGKYFIGGGDWCEAASWVPAGVPTLGDDVTLRTNATVLTGCVAEANSINLDGNTLTIEDGGQLKSNNDVNATIKKHITSYGESTDGGWYLVGFPTDIFPGPFPIDLGLITTESDYDLYYFAYNVPDGLEWRNYKAGSINRIQALLRYGYLYANAADMDIVMSNNLNGSANDDVIRLFYDGDYVFKGWELHGNPFPCDAYVLDNATGEYRNFYRMNDAGDGFIAATGVVHPMEGFFTQATATGEKIRISRNAPAVQGNMLSINLIEANSTHRNAAPTDRAILRFGEGSALEKFSFRESTSKVYIPQGGKDYAIVSVGRDAMHCVSTEIPVNFKAAKNGEYTLSFSLDGMDLEYLHLIDNLTGADVDLLSPAGSPFAKRVGGFNEPATYTFTAKTTDYASRFRLVFSKDAHVDNGDDAPFAYISNGEIVINDATNGATLQIVDVLGRVVVCTDVARNVSTSGIVPGVYVLRLIDGDSVRTQKIVVP